VECVRRSGWSAGIPRDDEEEEEDGWLSDEDVVEEEAAEEDPGCVWLCVKEKGSGWRTARNDLGTSRLGTGLRRGVDDDAAAADDGGAPPPPRPPPSSAPPPATMRPTRERDADCTRCALRGAREVAAGAAAGRPGGRAGAGRWRVAAGATGCGWGCGAKCDSGSRSGLPLRPGGGKKPVPPSPKGIGLFSRETGTE
jgi:hypothetical protein